MNWQRSGFVRTDLTCRPVRLAGELDCQTGSNSALHQIKYKLVLHFHQVLAKNNVYFVFFPTTSKTVRTRNISDVSTKTYKLKMNIFRRVSKPSSILTST